MKFVSWSLPLSGASCSGASNVAPSRAASGLALDLRRCLRAFLVLGLVLDLAGVPVLGEVPEPWDSSELSPVLDSRLPAPPTMDADPSSDVSTCELAPLSSMVLAPSWGAAVPAPGPSAQRSISRTAW